MTARNMFLTVGGILLVVAILAALLGWRPFSSGLLVSENATPANTISPADVSESHVSASVSTVKEGDHYVSIIRYNGDTFNPRILIVNRGENVRFVNGSTLSMRIEANNAATTTSPAMYQQAQSVGHNGAYELSFESAGVWIVKNLNDQSSDNVAVIYVK